MFCFLIGIWLRKKMMIAENTPEGKPIKIEKKILLDRISVTAMVTRINVINDIIADKNRFNF